MPTVSDTELRSYCESAWGSAWVTRARKQLRHLGQGLFFKLDNIF